MSYQLFKQKFGTNKQELISELNVDEIKDVCYVKELGFLFTYKDSVGLIDLNGNIDYSFVNFFSNPSKIFYCSNLRTCFVFEDGNKNLKCFNIDLKVKMPFFGLPYGQKWSGLFNNIKDNYIEGTCDNSGRLYMISSFYNEIFMLFKSEFKHFCGGKNEILFKKFFQKPKGITFYKKCLYISDTGNSRIRKIFSDKKAKTVISSENGHNIDNPSKIRILDNILFFVDGNNIRYSLMSNKDCGIIYSGDFNFVDWDNKKNLYIWTKYE